MKNLRWLLPAALLLATLTWLAIQEQRKPTTIVNPTDYAAYLVPDHLAKAKEEIGIEQAFWQKKLATDPDNYIYLIKKASLLSQAFKLTGDVAHLQQSDQILEDINTRIPNQVKVLHLLANNAITQHQFQKAEDYLVQAKAIGNERYTTMLMMADVRLERGQNILAQDLLDKMESRNQFDYLIRQMKYEDVSDNLSGAIQAMEKAAKKAQRSGKKALINWSYSNLADMYGHDGRIQQSYDTYLQALANDPADLHSLKGIAWITFSYEQDTEEAKRILEFLKSVHPIPDYDLLLAEIADFEGNQELADACRAAFYLEATKADYGKMYTTYLAELDRTEIDALALVEEDVQDRPHPVIFDLKAWTLFRKGNPQAAIDLWEQEVAEQTGEPITAYHAGVMYGALGEKQKAKKYLREARAASFELGPVISAEVEQYLRAL